MSFDCITSRSNPAVIAAASLRDKKYRDRAQRFLVDGVKLFDEAVKRALPIAAVYISESSASAFLPKVEAAFADRKGDAPRILVLKDFVFDKITEEKSPQGLITEIKYLDFFEKRIKINREELSSLGMAVMLWGLQDPGNLGAVCRSAAAFGANTVILAGSCADVYHPKTVRSSMGTVFGMRVISVQDAEGTVAVLRDGGRRVFSAELRPGAVSVDGLALSRDDIFVIGNEGHGIPETLSLACTGSVYIPIAENVESLNAAVAAAVLLWMQNRGER